MDDPKLTLLLLPVLLFAVASVAHYTVPMFPVLLLPLLPVLQLLLLPVLLTAQCCSVATVKLLLPVLLTAAASTSFVSSTSCRCGGACSQLVLVE